MYFKSPLKLHVSIGHVALLLAGITIPPCGFWMVDLVANEWVCNDIYLKPAGSESWKLLIEKGWSQENLHTSDRFMQMHQFLGDWILEDQEKSELLMKLSPVCYDSKVSHSGLWTPTLFSRDREFTPHGNLYSNTMDFRGWGRSFSFVAQLMSVVLSNQLSRKWVLAVNIA